MGKLHDIAEQTHIDDHAKSQILSSKYQQNNKQSQIKHQLKITKSHM